LASKGSNAEVGQLIASIKFGCFLTPDMVSKNDARHDIGLFSPGMTQCHVWHHFLTPCLASKKLPDFNAAINCPTSANKPSSNFEGSFA